MRISCNLLESFLRDMIDWTQIKLDKFKKRKEKFDLKETLDQIMEMMKFKSDIKGIYCNVEFLNDVPPLVQGDKQRFM